MITEQQVEAAAESLWDDYRLAGELSLIKSMTWPELCHAAQAPSAIKLTVETCRRFAQSARAALEAAEAAAWSRDLSAAPPSAPLLIFMGSSLDTGMVLENPSTGERTWWSGDFRVNPEDIWMWRHVPKPTTEGDR